MTLSNRTILVTGASSGVGRHLAEMLASEGANMVCCARRTAMLDTLVERISSAGGNAVSAPCDVTSPKSVASAFDIAEKHFGIVDSVIVNAGVNNAGPFVEASVSDIDAVLSVNLRGALLTARESGKRMVSASKNGDEKSWRIIFVASILGLKPTPGAATYAATKAGVIMLAKSLALEWARRGISVNALCPGYMPTDIVEDWFVSEGGKRQIAGWPRRRLMAVDKLDGTMRLLLSEEGSAITGTAMVVDDGQSLV